MKIVPFILVKSTFPGAIGHLLFDFSIILLKHLGSSAIFKDSAFRRIVLGFVKVFIADKCSLLTGDVISYLLGTSKSF